VQLGKERRALAPLIGGAGNPDLAAIPAAAEAGGQTCSWVAPAAELMTLAHVEYRPQALGEAIRRASSLHPHLPILVTENGIATTDDEQRIRFTADALHGLQAAIADGADVRGYFHWSLLDNFEWFAGYRPSFGLIAVDRTNFVCTPKPSLAWLGAFATRNRVS
jgi:beta-glucosidase